jgi:hypothetical protein
VLQNKFLRAICGAYKATPIRNLEVEIGVPPLGIHLDSLQARFRVRLEESEVAQAIREAVGKVERQLGIGLEGSGRKRKRGRREMHVGMNPGNSRGRNAVSRGRDEGERGRAAVGEDGRVVEDGVEMAFRGLPQGTTTTLHQSRLSWALQWLPDDDPCRPLSLQTRTLRKAKQYWHSMWQASAKSPAPSTSIEAPPGTDVLALHQLLQKPETALAV